MEDLQQRQSSIVYVKSAHDFFVPSSDGLAVCGTGRTLHRVNKMDKT